VLWHCICGLDSKNQIETGLTLDKSRLLVRKSNTAWNDLTAGAVRFLDAMVARSKNAETPRLGLHLVLGSDFPEMVRNFLRNLEEERCGVVEAVFERIS
jgi:hypothetical protein